MPKPRKYPLEDERRMQVYPNVVAALKKRVRGNESLNDTVKRLIEKYIRENEINLPV